MSARFSLLTTPEILRLLGTASGRPLTNCVRFGRRCGGRLILGDDSGYAARAAQIVQNAGTLLSNAAAYPFGVVYRGLRDSQIELQRMAVSAAALPGEALATLADRMGATAEALSLHAAGVLRNVASGAGDAYREFFGFPPIVAILLGLVVVAGGGYLLLSPGGQQLLSRGGGWSFRGGGRVFRGLGEGARPAGNLMAADLPPGVDGSPNVELNPSLSFFLRRLRSTVPTAIPLYVNSGYRSPERQAAAMLTKLQMGDDLQALYGSKVNALLMLPQNLGVWAAALENLARTGLYMSDHMRGDAVDLRIQGLSTSEIAQLVSAAKQLGASPSLESIPPHLHIDGISAGNHANFLAATGRPIWTVQNAPNSHGWELGAVLLAVGALAIFGPAAGLALPMGLKSRVLLLLR